MGHALGPIQYERTPATGAKWHPLANLFPVLENPAYNELVADIKANGVLEPIVRLEGAILDGRNRYLAARQLKVDYPVVEYLGDDPLGFVISRNMSRRHLTESQRAMIAARIAELQHGGDRRSDQAANLRLETQASAAAVMKVSTRSVQLARRVKRSGVPELAAAVEGGSISVSAAAELTRLPKSQQIETLHQGAAAVKRLARHLRISASDVNPGKDAAASTRHLHMLESAWSACSPAERQTFMNRHGLLYTAGQIDAEPEASP